MVVNCAIVFVAGAFDLCRQQAAISLFRAFGLNMHADFEIGEALQTIIENRL